MRTIKFRVWDIERKKYLSDVSFADSRIPSNWQQFYIPQQFTGLLDKSGVEIYEGDVVKFEDDFTEIIDPELGGPTYTEYQLATVAFDCGGFGIVVRDSSDYLNEGFVTFDYVNRYIGDTPIEVIGNIHENPELLEGK